MSYRKGANAERAFIKHMEKEYYGVRAAGSHSMFDVILIPHNQLLNVVGAQLKVGSHPPASPPKEFKDFVAPDNFTKWYVRRKDRGKWEITPVP